MRKAFAILLTLLLLFSAGFATTHMLVNGQKEQIIWEEETLHGDLSAVEGAVVRTRNHLSRHLLWETEGILGEGMNPVTSFTFSNESIESETIIQYGGISLYASEDFLASLSFSEPENVPGYAREKYADLIAYCQACYDSVEVGYEKEFQADLKKYMDYYSLSGVFDFPNTDWYHFNEFESRGAYAFRVEDSITMALNEFFRIPILGDYVAEFSIDRRQNGVSFGGGAYDPSVYRPDFDAVYVNDTCYLTFDTVAESGEVADTSLIPGGYGLYRLNIRPDGEGGLIADDPIATMVYSMDPSEKFSYLETSDDERHIYIHTWQGSKLMRTIVDIETMQTLQKIELCDQDESFYREIKQYDDFLVILQLSINNVNSEANTISVFAEDGNGLYEHRFTVPMNGGGLDVNDDLLIFASVTTHLDFKDDTLYVIQNEFQSDRHAYAYGDNSHFYVLAYDPGGLAYAGKYHVNLAEINARPEYDDLPVDPFYERPVEIMKN